MNPIDRLIQYLETEGFEPGAPSLRVEAMDKTIVEGNDVLQPQECECGNYLNYLPFTRPNPHREYKAFAVCKACGYYRKL